ncbi:hypothetical protein ACMA1I_04665 [Pontibacter sp. 13R65]|uniref:hypothetical protein n=1 Tax=Pontibacter sp. 13R65 TaxID=3127458 RepID=UPI00301E2AA0
MKLNNIPKHNIYKVPEGYFDRLPQQVMERTAHQGAGVASPAFSYWKPVRLALAPLVLLLLFGSVFFLNMQQEQKQVDINAYATVLADTEIVAYLSTAYVDLETSDFEELNLTKQELTSDFINISPETAEKELEYYQLSNLNY